MSTTQSSEDEQITVQELIDILQKAEEYAVEEFDKVRSQGVTIPQAAEQSLNDGLSVAEEAVQSFNQGNLSGAKILALEALQHFRDALDRIEEINDIEAQAQRLICLREAASRAESIITNLEAIADQSELAGYDVSEIRQLLETAEQHLNNAMGFLDEAQSDSAESELSETWQTLSLVLIETKKIAEFEKVGLAMSFMDGIEERIFDVEEKLATLPIPPFVKYLINSILNGVKSLLAEAESLINEGNIDEAIDKLQEASQELKEAEGLLD